MVGKICLFLCVQAAFLQSISGQYCGRSSSCGCSTFDGFSKTATYSTGGPVTITCSGPLTTSGVSLVADLSMDGNVDVCGSMPFVSAVTLEGTLPTTGCGTVAYGCGDGNIMIYQENGSPSGTYAASNSGLGQCGCGCNY